MRVVNLTPHDISICDPQTRKVIKTYPKTGTEARAGQDGIAIDNFDGVPVVPTEYTTLENVPPPTQGTVYIVSSIVLQHPDLKGRGDLICPDTGPTSVRDEKGRPVGAIRWIVRRDVTRFGPPTVIENKEFGLTYVEEADPEILENPLVSSLMTYMGMTEDALCKS